MTTTDTPTFSGLPINGDIVFGTERKDQRTEEEFLTILQPVLDDAEITSIRWHQYTPYFNDGDPCVFGAWGLQVNDRDGADEEDDDYNEFPSGRYGEFEYPFGTRDYHTDVYTGPDEARYDRLRALQNAIEGGEFDDVLLQKFGDHAYVRVVAGDGIYVDYYEHD